MTPEQEAALAVARDLARAGVPLFLALADEGRPTGFQEPYGWNRAEPDPTVPDHWRPGMALCAVMGRALDLVDVDPRNGGALRDDLPRAYLEAETPSGGRHLFVAPLGLESRDNAWPGVDYKGGAPDGSGRGYAFIAPTVRASKVDGAERPYRWLRVPAPVAVDPEDASGRALADRVRGLRAARPAGDRPRRLPVSAAVAEWGRALAALEADVRRWGASGWGGEAHAGLLRHGTHLARLSPDHAEAGYRAAFAAAGVEPDEDDLAKLEGALARVVPDAVVPDEEFSPADLFLHGVPAAPDGPPKAPDVDEAAVAAASSVTSDEEEELRGAVARELFRHEVRERVRVALHERTWRAPPDHGHLGRELALPDEGPTWRVDGLLGVGHNAVLVAGRKAGKTTVVVELVRCLADKEPFLGAEVTPADGGVALFNYELTERQQRAWLRDAGIRNLDRVHVLHLRGRTLPLGSPQVRAWVAGWLRDRGVRTWVLDPYSRAYVGSVDDGNDEAQVGAFLDHLDRVKHEAGVTELVMPVHAPKAARWDPEALSAIGSQRLEAWPDAIWYLGREGSAAARYFRAEGRDVSRPEALVVRAPAPGDPLGHLRLSTVERTTGTSRSEQELSRVLDYVRANPGRGTNRVMEDLGLGKGKASSLLTVAEDEGLAYHVQGPNRSKLWHATDGGPSGPGAPVDHV